MPLSPGERLGPYEILSPLGAGGMGEVYKARDTRLGRIVAIKVSQAAFSDRFEKEARAVAALNHPNIAALYDVGPNYLVMEFVEGPMLAERIRGGALTADEQLSITRQLIDAIEAAHDRNIIHRDLKPENVKITPDGVVKVLDFGLAKSQEPLASTAETLTAGTMLGAIMGTPGYMAPEQARGLTVDKRADIWAFGVMLHEMSTGQGLFDGETISDKLASLLTKTPDIDVLPPCMRKLTARCLEKDPKKRLRDIADARFLLDDAPPAAGEKPQSAGRLPWIAAAVCATALAVQWYRNRPVEQPLVRFEFTPETEPEIFSPPSISPDGAHISFIAKDKNGKFQLIGRQLDQPKMTVLSPNAGVLRPAYSADSKWIGYLDETGPTIKRVPREGGTPIRVADLQFLDSRLAWLGNGEILTKVRGDNPVLRIPIHGGNTIPVPNSGRLGGCVQVRGTPATALCRSEKGLEAVSLSTGKRVLLDDYRPASFPSFQSATTGHVLFEDAANVLQAIPFDNETLQPAGTAFPLIENVAGFDLSDTGTLVLRVQQPRRYTIDWLDRSGKRTPVVAAPGVYNNLALSKNGRWLAYEEKTGSDERILFYDFERGVTQKLSTDGGTVNPVWLPEGDRILHLRSDRKLYVSLVDGSGTSVPVTGVAAAIDGIRLLWDLSPDGRRLMYARGTENTARDIWIADFESSGGSYQLKNPRPFADTAFDEITAAFSPDGRWVAYASNESGETHVYVRASSGSGGKWRISSAPSWIPEWHPKSAALFMGTNLFYQLSFAPFNVRNGEFVSGPPVEFAPNNPLGTVFGATRKYAVAPDGRVIGAMPAPGGDDKPRYVVIQNFHAEIKRRAAR